MTYRPAEQPRTYNHLEEVESPSSRSSHKRGLTAVVAGFALAGALAGCGGGVDATPTASTKPEVTTSAPVGAETIKPADSSPSEKAYAGYLDTLTPEQKTVRENLTPDSLANMSDTQVTEAFTIRASEVTDGKGKINLKQYEEAFAARSGAVLMAGCSAQEYAETVRTSVNIPKTAAQHALAVKYNELATPALYGHQSGDIKANEYAILRCQMMDDLRASGTKPTPNAYLVRATLTDKPIDAFVHPNNSVDIKITTRLMDNYNTALMSQLIGIDTPTTDRLDTYTITGLHIDSNGAVVPGTIALNQ